MNSYGTCASIKYIFTNTYFRNEYFPVELCYLQRKLKAHAYFIFVWESITHFQPMYSGEILTFKYKPCSLYRLSKIECNNIFLNKSIYNGLLITPATDNLAT